MKTFLLSVATLFTLITAKAQTFSENFNNSTIASLEADCWVLSGAQIAVTPESISGISLSSLPSTNTNAKTDVYTPILDIASTTPNVNFDYRLTSTLNGNAYRIIEVGLVSTKGDLVQSDVIYLAPGTGTTVFNYSHSFNNITVGNYRVVFRLSGAYGNGNVRIVLDNLEVTPATLVPSTLCVLVPIVEKTLPIKLKYFTAQLNGKSAELNWVTSMELNFSHFVVERSYNGTDFTEIATIFGYGNSMEEKSYRYIDKTFAPDKAVVYYRLRQVDIDEKNDYSAIRMIRNSDEDIKRVTIMTYPNPVSSEVRVTIPLDWQNKMVVYEVINMNGQIATKVFSPNSGQTEILNVSNLSRGIYIVRANCEGKIAQQKIVKQ